MWDFILCELLNLNYIAPVWFYKMVFKVSLVLEILCILSLIMIGCNTSNNKTLKLFVEKIYDVFASFPCFLCLLGLNTILVLTAPQKEIWISTGLLAFIALCYGVGIFLVFGGLREDDGGYEF